MRRLVLVTETSLVANAMAAALRRSGEFDVVGYVSLRAGTSSLILGAEPDVVIVADGDRLNRAVEVLHELRDRAPKLALVVLSDDMDSARLDALFAAGATGALFRGTEPRAMVTLLRETLNGHFVHPAIRSLQPSEDCAGPGLALLTRRELQILALVAAGATNSDVARALWVTERTIKFHLRNIYRKLEVANRTEASYFAHVNGLVPARPPLAAAS